MTSQLLKCAMQPVIKALIAKQLLRHPDVDVNISVACCICEVLRIMVYKTPYTDEQMKDFFELVVTALENLSSASCGSYNRMIKALKTLDKGKLSLMMCHLQLDGLIVRLFKQFLTVADSNSPGVVIKMKQIIIMIIKNTELLNHELVDLLVTSVRKENKIASPVCWQLGREVFKKCATQLKPRLPKKVAEEVYGILMETIPSTTDTSKLGNDATHKRKVECLNVSRNMVQPARRCRVARKCKKKSVSTDDPLMPTKSVSEDQSVEHGENLVGKRIKVWWPADKKYYQGVVKSSDRRNKRHKVLYDDGEEEFLDLKQEQWELAETASRLSAFEIKLGNEVLKKCAAKRKPHLLDQAQSVEHGENLVEKRIKVWWPADKKYYQGVVKSFDRRNNWHKVLYDDGEEELLDLKQEQWELAETASRLSAFEIKLGNDILKKCAAKLKSHLLGQVSSEDEELIDLTGKQWEPHENVSASSDSDSFDNDDESFMDLTQEELAEKMAHSLGQAPPPGDMISVQGYSVKQSIAPTLEAIFKKYGDILADCSFQIASVRTCFLEVICEVVKRIESSDVSTIIADMDEIESKVSQAAAANINVTWLRDLLKSIHTRNEALKKTASFKEMKITTTLVKRAARADVIERCQEHVAAQERCVKAEECIKVLDRRADLVQDKPISTIISKRAARADMRERCRERVIAQEEFEKAERCVTVLTLVEEKLSKDILESQAESTHG